MKVFVLGLLVGAILGSLTCFYFFVGVPSATSLPGHPITPPNYEEAVPGTAQIVLKQDFFNNVLATVFQEMNPPAFSISGDASRPQTVVNGGCDGAITILPEGSGVRTEVRFDNGRISSPLAFKGSYNSPFGCLEFAGWAQAGFQLRFDPQQQSVFGTIEVETVNLDGVNPLLSGLVTPIVQTTLNNRVNPIRLLDGSQIAVNLPITAAAGDLIANVQDVRAEVKDNALNLFIIYDFKGGPSAAATNQ